MCDQITTKVSKLKRDFIGAPIRRALIATSKGETFDNCEIPYRKDEKYWLICPKAGKMILFFGINFEMSDD